MMVMMMVVVGVVMVMVMCLCARHYARHRNTVSERHLYSQMTVKTLQLQTDNPETKLDGKETQIS
jgi:Tfp pilus assembly protein PilV